MDTHLESTKHQQSKARKRQHGEQTALPFKPDVADLKREVVLDFLQMCASADIPFNKSPALVPFLKKHCQIGGAIPGECQLRRTYLPILWAEHIKKLKSLLEGRVIGMEVDETTDNRAQQVSLLRRHGYLKVNLPCR